MNGVSDELLFRYLLGDLDSYGFLGLVDRVSERVQSYARTDAPRFTSVSVMATGGSASHGDSQGDGVVFDLYLYVRGFLGLGTNPAEEQARLKKAQSSDVEALTVHPAYLGMVKQHLFNLRDRSGDVTKVWDLLEFLKQWMGSSCDHDFRPLDSSVQGVQVMVCHCGARYADSDSGWHAL